MFIELWIGQCVSHDSLSFVFCSNPRAFFSFLSIDANKTSGRRFEYERRARDISDQLLGAVASDETLLKDPDWLGDILTSAIPADGVGVWINGGYAFSGVTPPTDDFRRIIRALNGTRAGKVYATNNIGFLIEGAASFAKRHLVF